MENSPANGEQSLSERLNSPAMKALRKAWQESEAKQNAEDDAWWDSLSYAEKGQAFRQVVKLMHKAEVTDRGSYRYALYDVFGLDYGDGLAHYMRLHNLIYLGLEAEEMACRKDERGECDGDTSGRP